MSTLRDVLAAPGLLRGAIRRGRIGVVAAGSLAIATSCGRVEFVRIPDAARDGAAEPDARDPCEITTGLIGHWTLDAADVSGGMVIDRSGNGRHGVILGTPAPTVAAARVGEGLDFRATNTAFVEVGSVPFAAGAGAYNSVVLWFWNDNAAVDDVLAYLPPGPGAAPPRYDLWLNRTRIGVTSLCINTGSGECWGVSDPGLLGRWVHVAAVFVNGLTTGGQLFVDGVAAAPTCRFGSCTQTRTAQPQFQIAGNDSTYAWHGMLDDVRLFDRALTAQEVQALHACAP